jgi:ABC-type nitrate/sulfonate/bicarbonate transport system substrate-binding protein
MTMITRRGCLAGAAALATPGVARGQTEEFVFGLPSTSLGAAMPRLTEELGLYAKHGLKVRLPVLETAAVAANALVSGSVKAIQAGPAELIAAQDKGQRIVAIGTAYAGLAQSLVLSKAAAAKSGVAPDAPLAARMKALEGLTIATTSATASATAALRLTAQRLGGVAVRFTYLAQPNFAPALERGAIDGYIGSAPFSTFGVVRGLGVLWMNGPAGEAPAEFRPANAGIIMAMRAYAESNPDAIRRLRGAYSDFSAMVEADPERVKAAIRKLHPDLDTESLDYFYRSESRAWRFQPVAVATMEHEIRFVRESGMNLTDPAGLNAAAMVL